MKKLILSMGILGIISSSVFARDNISAYIGVQIGNPYVIYEERSCPKKVIIVEQPRYYPEREVYYIDRRPNIIIIDKKMKKHWDRGWHEGHHHHHDWDED